MSSAAGPLHDDWDHHWSNLNAVTELNPAQHYRHQLLRRLIHRELREHPQMRTIVDFGSGQGDLIQLIAPIVGDRPMIGLELSRVGVEIASGKVPQATFYQVDLVANVPRHPELHDKGDLCICSEVLEHLDDPNTFMRHVREYMAPGGKLIVTVPSGPMNNFEKSIGHRQHFTPETISRVVASAGLQVLRVERAGFPFFNLYKIAGYLRGDKIRTDAETNSSRDGPTGAMKLALKTFDMLFKFNLPKSPFGWQLVVVAQNPSR